MEALVDRYRPPAHARISKVAADVTAHLFHLDFITQVDHHRFFCLRPLMDLNRGETPGRCSTVYNHMG
jgi:hypothetical protein